MNTFSQLWSAIFLGKIFLYQKYFNEITVAITKDDLPTYPLPVLAADPPEEQRPDHGEDEGPGVGHGGGHQLQQPALRSVGGQLLLL